MTTKARERPRCAPIKAKRQRRRHGVRVAAGPAVPVKPVPVKPVPVKPVPVKPVPVKPVPVKPVPVRPGALQSGALAQAGRCAERERPPRGSDQAREGGTKGRSAFGSALYEAADDRRDPVGLLEEQSTTLEPALVPVRYGRMLVSQFSFFRGASIVFASDLRATPSTGMTAQLCGDAHMSNFGVFSSPERYLYFDVNEFDQSAPGPCEWDVKRLAPSLEVAGRDNGYSERAARGGGEKRGAVLQGGHVRVLGDVDDRRLVRASRHRPAAAEIPLHC